MENLYADTPEDAPEHLTGKISRHMDACAGIAILPTKYPFFRGYELAEQLCDATKKSMRELAKSKENLRGSRWLDFAILHGEQAPTLEQIRSTEYVDAEIVHDEFGFPYFPGKRFKGLLYESAVEVVEMFALSVLANELMPI